MAGVKTAEEHVQRFFFGHRVTPRKWTQGPGRTALPDLRILEVAPGPRFGQWTYVTIGAANAGLRPLEFLTVGDEARDTYVELLTMVAFYAIEHRLGLGHTIPIGRPLLEGSRCDHVYLSLPYLFGPDLEVIQLAEAQQQILWLFPITESEKRLLLATGLDAFEDRLEAENVEYGSPFRRSVA